MLRSKLSLWATWFRCHHHLSVTQKLRSSLKSIIKLSGSWFNSAEKWWHLPRSKHCPNVPNRHFPQHLRVSLPHLLWGFIRTSPLQGIVPWTTSLKTANLPLTLPHTRMPTPAHVLLSVARRHDCTLTYYYGLNHITKEMIKTSSSVPVKVTFLGKVSLQVTKLRKRGH